MHNHSTRLAPAPPGAARRNITGPWRQRAAIAIALMLFMAQMAIAATASFAHSDELPANAPLSVDASVGAAGGFAPDGSPDVNAFDFDPAFAAGGFGIDRFADSSAHQYLGQKLVRLDNGDIVLAGIVPRSGSNVSNQVGLVRYTAAGRRVAWTNVDAAWSRFGNQYIVYPNGSSGQPSGAFIGVVGIQASGGNLYVMANEQSADGSVHPIVMVFAQSGFFRGWWSYFPGGDSHKPGTGFVIAGSKLIVLGADPVPADVPTRPQMWMSRYTIADNGALSFDDTFGSGGFAFYRAFACQVAATATSCQTFPAGIAAQGGMTIPLSPKFYVVASVKGSGHTEYGTVVLRFNGNGTRDTGFGYDTNLGYDIAEVGFHDGGDNADMAVAIRTSYHIAVPFQLVEDIYVVSKVSRSVQTGIGVFRMDSTGQVVPGFGDGGKVLFGGCGNGSGNCEYTNVEDVPWSMVLSGGHLAIGGWFRGYEGAAPGSPVMFNYPMFALVNAGTGAIENFHEYTIGIGGATFYDVVANGDGTFTMAGDARESANGNNLTYLAARLQPHDFIFRNGVD